MLNLKNREVRKIKTPNGIGTFFGVDPVGERVTVQFPGEKAGRRKTIPGAIKNYSASECEEIEE